MYVWKNIEELKGKILTEIVKDDDCGDQIIFTCLDGDKYKMYHSQDCCESVYIESIVGDLDDLLNSEILEAEVVSQTNEDEEDYGDSYTWTFYKLGTRKGSVTIRWYGTSNGYYSESVDFVKL